jgi:phospholipid/cholesterol/gamma-HCH transport system substrate-binding protein
MAARFDTPLKVGLTTIISLSLLFGGVLWVKEYNPLVGKRDITVAFEDAQGIAPGDPVTLSGIRIGEVGAVRLGDSNRALVSFAVFKEADIRSDAVYTIRDVGLMGDKMLAIDPGSSANDLDPDVVQTGTMEPGMSDLFAGAGALLDKLDRLAGTIESDLDIAGLNTSFSETLVRLQSAADEYRSLAVESREPITRTLRTLESSSVAIERFIDDNDDRFKTMIESFRTTSAHLDDTLDEFDNVSTVVDTVAKQFIRGEGTMAKLITTEDLYRELRRTNAHIDSFVVDLRTNPGKYTKDMKFKVSLF